MLMTFDFICCVHIHPLNYEYEVWPALAFGWFSIPEMTRTHTLRQRAYDVCVARHLSISTFWYSHGSTTAIQSKTMFIFASTIDRLSIEIFHIVQNRKCLNSQICKAAVNHNTVVTIMYSRAMPNFKFIHKWNHMHIPYAQHDPSNEPNIAQLSFISWSTAFSDCRWTRVKRKPRTNKKWSSGFEGRKECQK